MRAQIRPRLQQPLISLCITAVIDRTALFVARSANPPQFETKIRQNQVNDPKFSFLNPADPYHAYYRHRMDRIAAGEEDEAASATPAKEVEGQAVTPIPQLSRGREPPAPEFILEVPHIAPVDLYVTFVWLRCHG